MNGNHISINKNSVFIVGHFNNRFMQEKESNGLQVIVCCVRVLHYRTRTKYSVYTSGRLSRTSHYFESLECVVSHVPMR